MVSVLMATSTLAAGVNLPARRVIFRSAKIGMDGLDVTRYKQMAGRAGRTGIDDHGTGIHSFCAPTPVWIRASRKPMRRPHQVSPI